MTEGPYRLPWLWVEGWRERLRKSGDVVEMARWEFRLDDVLRGRNDVPVIVATPGPRDSVLRLPSAGVLEDGGGRGGGGEARGSRWMGRKEVRFE